MAAWSGGVQVEDRWASKKGVWRRTLAGGTGGVPRAWEEGLPMETAEKRDGDSSKRDKLSLAAVSISALASSAREELAEGAKERMEPGSREPLLPWKTNLNCGEGVVEKGRRIVEKEPKSRRRPPQTGGRAFEKAGADGPPVSRAQECGRSGRSLSRPVGGPLAWHRGRRAEGGLAGAGMGALKTCEIWMKTDEKHGE